MDSTRPADKSSSRKRLADRLTRVARAVFFALAVICLVVVPWFFGGMGPDGYYLTVWAGRLCLLPLALWLAARVLRRRAPRASFWVPVLCWSALAVIVFLSTKNPSHVAQPPWEGDGYTPVAHDERLPSTAFVGGTVTEARLWVSIGLLALTARVVGLSAGLLRALLWAFAGNVTLLSLAGIPFKFSGQLLVLGKWPAPEWYFYSTFLYHNHWCPFALLGLAAVAALFVSYKNTKVRLGLIVAGCIIAGSAPLSTSRMGTLAMLAFGAWILWSWRRSARKKSARAKNGRREIGDDGSGPISNARSAWIALVLGLSIVAGGAFFFLKTEGGPGGQRNWDDLLVTNPFGIRASLFEDTLSMIGDKPVFGWGLGAYGAGFRFYQRPETRIVYNQGRITLYEHAHDDWIERLAELGLVGYALFLAPGIYWLRQGLWHRKLRPSALWLFAGCVGVLLFALGDMVFVNTVVASSFAVLFALSLIPESAGPRTGETLKGNSL
jgi:O-antigen ligase